LSELRPDSPVRRPASARARKEAPTPAPPDRNELEAILEHLVTQPAQEGASVEVDEEVGVIFVRGPGSGPDLTYAARPRWTAETWPTSLAAVRRRILDAGGWPSLLLTDTLDRPPQLEAAVEQLGWLRVTGESVMWAGHASVVPHLDPGMRIEAVRSRSLATHEALERRIFGIGAEQAERRRDALGAALDAGRLRAWIVWVGDEPVAVARLSQGNGVAGLQGVGVVEERRNQGYGTLVTTVATRAGLATGNRVVWLSVHEDNAAAVHLYAQLGFARAFSWSRWLLTEDPRRR
jgi:ribosomal protein S18 acetylase RimI-like enzyme